jgi:hypothetical protein
MLGMNDAAYQDFDTTSFTVYSKGYVHLVEGLRQTIPSLRITLLQPSPFDDVTRAPQYALRDGGYNNVIVRYGQFVRDLAQKENLDVIDVNATLVAVLKRADLSDHALAEKIVPDRIHPSTAGALVIASAILGAWNATAVGSSVEIDAFRARVQHQVNANVTSIQTKATVSWTQRDSALPLPLNPKDDVLALVLRSSTIVESLDQQLLKVTGLRAAKYSLSIDGKKIGTWTRENLAHGVNLALLETPMLKQALRVYALSRRRNSVRMARWQSVQVALQESLHLTYVKRWLLSMPWRTNSSSSKKPFPCRRYTAMNSSHRVANRVDLVTRLLLRHDSRHPYRAERRHRHIERHST